MSKPTIYIVKDGDGKVISKGNLKETAEFFKMSKKCYLEIRAKRNDGNGNAQRANL